MVACEIDLSVLQLEEEEEEKPISSYSQFILAAYALKQSQRLKMVKYSHYRYCEITPKLYKTILHVKI